MQNHENGDPWVTVGGNGKSKKNGKSNKEIKIELLPDISSEPKLYAPTILLPGWDYQQASKQIKSKKKGAVTPLNRHLTCIEDCKQAVCTSPFYATFVDTLGAFAAKLKDVGLDGISHTNHAIMWGLGSLEDSKVSRCQLVLMLLLLERHLPSLISRPITYDPAYSTLDQELLRSLGFDELMEDRSGSQVVDVPTFFYLPHCEASLCESLLSCNWSVPRLSRMLLLSNSFAAYRDRWAFKPAVGHNGAVGAQIRPEKLLLLEEKGCVMEVKIHECNFPTPGAFNDLALHAFIPDKLLAAGIPLDDTSN